MLPHAEDNWWCSLLAGAGPGRLFGGSIFRTGRPGCPLTHIYKYPLSNGGEGGCLPGLGKEHWEARKKKRGKEKERARREVLRNRSAEVGGLQRGSEGPLPRIFLCGCSFGLAQVTEGGVQEKPLVRGVTHTLRPLFSGRQTPQVRVCDPAPPAPLTPGRPRTRSHRVGCGGSVASPQGWQGDGGGRAGPHSAPGRPHSKPRGSLKLTKSAVPSSAWEPRAGGDKRGSGGRKSPRPDGRTPPLTATNPVLLGGDTGTFKRGVQDTDPQRAPKGGAKAAAKLSRPRALEFATPQVDALGRDRAARFAGGHRPRAGLDCWPERHRLAQSGAGGDPGEPLPGRVGGLRSEQPLARVQQ